MFCAISKKNIKKQYFLEFQLLKNNSFIPFILATNISLADMHGYYSKCVGCRTDKTVSANCDRHMNMLHQHSGNEYGSNNK